MLSIEDSFRCCSSEEDAQSRVTQLLVKLLPRSVAQLLLCGEVCLKTLTVELCGSPCHKTLRLRVLMSFSHKTQIVQL